MELYPVARIIFLMKPFTRTTVFATQNTVLKMKLSGFVSQFTAEITMPPAVFKNPHTCPATFTAPWTKPLTAGTAEFTTHFHVADAH